MDGWNTKHHQMCLCVSYKFEPLEPFPKMSIEDVHIMFAYRRCLEESHGITSQRNGWTLHLWMWPPHLAARKKEANGLVSRLVSWARKNSHEVSSNLITIRWGLAVSWQMENQTTISVSIRLKHGEVCINFRLRSVKKVFCLRQKIHWSRVNIAGKEGPLNVAGQLISILGWWQSAINPRIMVYIQAERTQDLNDNQHLKGLNSPPQISGSVRAGPQPKDLAKSLPVPCCSVKLHKRHWFEVFLQRALSHEEKQQWSHFWDPF